MFRPRQPNHGPFWDTLGGGETSLWSYADITTMQNDPQIGSITDGQQAIVLSTDNIWEWVADSTATADGITVVQPASAPVQGRWHRKASDYSPQGSPLYPSTQTPPVHVYINPTTGNDEAAGTLAAPLQTWAEFQRRFESIELGYTVVHLMGSIYDGATLFEGPRGRFRFRLETGLVPPTITRLEITGEDGRTTLADTATIGAVTTYTPATAAGPNWNELQTAGIADWTAYIGHRVRVVAGTNAGYIFWIVDTKPGDVTTALVTFPALCDPIADVDYTDFGTVGGPLDGTDQLVIEDLPSIGLVKLFPHDYDDAVDYAPFFVHGVKIEGGHVYSRNIDIFASEFAATTAVRVEQSANIWACEAANLTATGTPQIIMVGCDIASSLDLHDGCSLSIGSSIWATIYTNAQSSGVGITVQSQCGVYSHGIAAPGFSLLGANGSLLFNSAATPVFTVPRAPAANPTTYGLHVEGPANTCFWADSLAWPSLLVGDTGEIFFGSFLDGGYDKIWSDVETVEYVDQQTKNALTFTFRSGPPPLASPNSVPLCFSRVISLAGTPGGGPYDYQIWQVPVIAGDGIFVLTDLIVRLESVLTGTAGDTATILVGQGVGGNQLLAAVAAFQVGGGTGAVGTLGGTTAAEQGASFTTLFKAFLPGGPDPLSLIWLRNTVAGVAITGGNLRVIGRGYLMR